MSVFSYGYWYRIIVTPLWPMKAATSQFVYVWSSTAGVYKISKIPTATLNF